MADDRIELKIKRLDPSVELPAYAYAGDAGLGEEGAHLVLDLLRAVASRLELMTTAGRTLRRHLVGIATVVA